MNIEETVSRLLEELRRHLYCKKEESNGAMPEPPETEKAEERYGKNKK